MNNIEKLIDAVEIFAKNAEWDDFDNAIHSLKALQSSEPVLQLENGQILWSKMPSEYTGFLFTLPTSTVPLEKYNRAIEPVAEPISEFAKQPIGKILKNGEIDLYDTMDVINEMVGFEIFIHPQHVVYTHPPASVSLEKYNKLLDALKDAVVILEGEGIYPTAVKIFNKVIAEAEGKEG